MVHQLIQNITHLSKMITLGKLLGRRKKSIVFFMVNIQNLKALKYHTLLKFLLSAVKKNI